MNIEMKRNTSRKIIGGGRKLMFNDNRFVASKLEWWEIKDARKQRHRTKRRNKNDAEIFR